MRRRWWCRLRGHDWIPQIAYHARGGQYQPVVSRKCWRCNVIDWNSKAVITGPGIPVRDNREETQ